MNDKPEGTYRAQRHTPDQLRRLWEQSIIVLGIVATDTTLSRNVRHFQLTRNAREDRAQRDQLAAWMRNRWDQLRVAVASAEEAEALIDIVYDELIGLGPLAVPWRDDAVTEILVDAWNRIYVEKDGELLITDLSFRDPEHAASIARNLAQVISDRALSPTNPLVTAQLDGARVNFAYGRGIVASGIAISLRKFKPLMGMSGLLAVNALTEEMIDFLRDSVRARASVLVSGGTGVGKTTLINALSEAIPDTERVITIEDAFELKLANKFVVSLQTKEKASRDDDLIIDQEMLLVNTLRMRPDRIIVGEIREGRAASVMLAAQNTGHDGTMTTLHANNPEAALNRRLADLIRAGSGVSDDIAKRQICDAFDLVVQGTRRRGRRFVSAISEVGPHVYQEHTIKPAPLFTGELDNDGNPTFRRTGTLHPGGNLIEKMFEAGIDATRWTTLS